MRRFTVLVTVHVQLGAAGTTLANTATGTATQPDPVDSNNSATDRLTVGTAADLAVQKAAAIAPRVGGRQRDLHHGRHEQRAESGR